MSVPIAVDKGETENAPVEFAIAEFVLRCDFACRIRELRIGRVIFESGAEGVRILDQSVACHDEACLWRVCNRRSDQVFRAVEVSEADWPLRSSRSWPQKVSCASTRRINDRARGGPNGHSLRVRCGHRNTGSQKHRSTLG